MKTPIPPIASINMPIKTQENPPKVTPRTKTKTRIIKPDRSSAGTRRKSMWKRQNEGKGEQHTTSRQPTMGDRQQSRNLGEEPMIDGSSAGCSNWKEEREREREDSSPPSLLFRLLSGVQSRENPALDLEVWARICSRRRIWEWGRGWIGGDEK